MQFPMRIILLALAFYLSGCGSSRPKPPPPGDPSLPEIDVLQLKENSEEALRLSQENRLELQSLHAKVKELEGRMASVSETVSNLPLYRFDTLTAAILGLRGDILTLNDRITHIPNAPPPAPKMLSTFSPNPNGLRPAASILPSGTKGDAAHSLPTPVDSATTKNSTPNPSPDKKALPAKPGKGNGARATASEAQAYKKAFDLFYSGDFKNARKKFQELLDQFPEGTYADNSQYWIGESEFSQGRFQEALTAFKKVLEFSESEKSDDAQLKVGYTFIRLGDKKLAAEAFRKLLSLYPDSEYLERAKEELGKLE
jgi:tol-pal system protein YbgF